MPPALRLRDRAPSEQARGVLPRLLGPPYRLPAVADRLAEGWWHLTPRTRTVLLGLGVGATLVLLLLRIVLSPYGPPVTVLVTVQELAVGDAPREGDVVATRWPRELLPVGTPATRADLEGARLTSGVVAGTVLTRELLRDDGPLADLAAGGAAVAVPRALLDGATTGTLLDLVTVAGDGSGRTIARDVRVLAVDGDTVWLELARERAADVAAAALRGTLSGAVLPQ